MKRVVQIALILGLSLGGFATGNAHAESPDDIAIIANNGVPLDKLEQGDLREIFLKKRLYWAAGAKVHAINAKKGTKLRQDFRARVLQMSLGDEQTYWQKLKIRTGDKAPVEFTSLLKAVFKVRGSISYVYRADLKPGVCKILFIVPAK